MKISIYNPTCLNELGSRKNQEDAVFPKMGHANEDSRLFIVCDGMGGHKYGEIASHIVCDSLAQYINAHWDGDTFNDQIFYEALHYSIDKLNVIDDDSVRKPGTTMTLLCLHNGGAFAAHIGDSRIYHIRPSEKRILYKSRDHSLVYDLFLSGEILQSEMSNHPKKNVLTRALLPNPESEPKADIIHITDILPEDIFILCSDGILENIDDAKLVNTLCSIEHEKDFYHRLKQETLNNSDNHSAYIICIKNLHREHGEEQALNEETISRSNAILFEKQINKSENSYWSLIISKLFRKRLNIGQDTNIY